MAGRFGALIALFLAFAALSCGVGEKPVSEALTGPEEEPETVVVTGQGIINQTGERVLGLVYSDPGRATMGYALFNPLQTETAYMVNASGGVENSWAGAHLMAFSTRLLKSGDILRVGTAHTNTFDVITAAGHIERLGWDGSVKWAYSHAAEMAHQGHHDIKPMPNGNLLMISWEYKSRDEAVAAGRNPALLGDGMLWPDYLLEVKPVGTDSVEVVWRWHAWDHMIQDFDATKVNYGDVAAHPELIDINYSKITEADLMHTNSLDYNEELDQILLSVKYYNEVWVLDHSTTTAEAAVHSGGRYGRGGDILYRWGNPRAYRAGDEYDQVFYGQHDAQWIEDGMPGEGNIIVFNNGDGRAGEGYSSVDEFKPAMNADGSYSLSAEGRYGPKRLAWRYMDSNPGEFYSFRLSGAQRLPNGNTFITHGLDGIFFEVTSTGETVWQYNNPDYAPEWGDLGWGVFKAKMYPRDYAGVGVNGLGW